MCRYSDIGATPRSAARLRIDMSSKSPAATIRSTASMMSSREIVPQGTLPDGDSSFAGTGGFPAWADSAIGPPYSSLAYAYAFTVAWSEAFFEARSPPGWPGWGSDPAAIAVYRRMLEPSAGSQMDRSIAVWMRVFSTSAETLAPNRQSARRHRVLVHRERRR